LPAETARELVEAARWTPSCYNRQPWRFHAVASPGALGAAREALAAGNRTWADRAPLLIVGSVRVEDDCRTEDGRDYAAFDLGMAVMNVMHAATQRGLLCRPMAGFAPAGMRAALALADDVQVLVVLAVGRPGDPAGLPPDVASRGASPRVRKRLEEILVVH
jgi:nitroreductase